MLELKSSPEVQEVTHKGVTAFLAAADVIAAVIKGKTKAVDVLRGEAERLREENNALEARAAELATLAREVQDGQQNLIRGEEAVRDREKTMDEAQRKIDAQRAEHDRCCHVLEEQREDLHRRTAEVDARADDADALQASLAALMSSKKE